MKNNTQKPSNGGNGNKSQAAAAKETKAERRK
jgi:hypothetical protein